MSCVEASLRQDLRRKESARVKGDVSRGRVHWTCACGIAGLDFPVKEFARVSLSEQFSRVVHVGHLARTP